MSIEQDNCRAALGWALKTHHAELGLRMVGALGDYWFWWANRWDEGLSWISQLLALPEAAVPKRARADALQTAVKLERLRGENVQANRLADEGLALFRDLGDKGGMAWGLLNKGRGRYALESNEWESLIAESLVLLQEMGDQRGIAMALWLLAGHKLNQGHMAEATALLEEGVTAVQAAGDDALAGQLYSSLGYVSYYSGDYARAVELMLQALALCREGGDTYGEMNTLVNLANVLLAQGDIERAASHLETSETWCRRAQHWAQLRFLLPYLGYVRHLQGDDDAARALLREAIILQQQQKRTVHLVESLERYAWIAADVHQPQRAARLLGATEAARERIAFPFPPGDKPLYDRHLARARADLDETMFHAAWAEGRAMTLEQAVAYALADDE